MEMFRAILITQTTCGLFYGHKLISIRGVMMIMVGDLVARPVVFITGNIIRTITDTLLILQYPPEIVPL